MRSSGRIQGYALLFSAAVCFSLMSMCVKALGAGHAVEATFARFTFGVVVIVLAHLCGWIRLRPVNWPLLIVRGVMGGGAVLCLFKAINHMGLAQGSVLSFSYPIFTSIFAWLFLKERPHWSIWAAMLVAFTGVYLIKGISGDLTYKLIALAGAVMGGIAVTSVRRLRRTDSSYTILLSMCAFGVMIAAGPAMSRSFDFDAKGWLIVLGVSLLALVGQLMFTYSYKVILATEGTIFTFVTPVLNVILGALIFHENISLQSWIGACLVLGPCIYVSVSGRNRPPVVPE